jgi:hypothetical protein
MPFVRVSNTTQCFESKHLAQLHFLPSVIYVLRVGKWNTRHNYLFYRVLLMYRVSTVKTRYNILFYLSVYFLSSILLTEHSDMSENTPNPSSRSNLYRVFVCLSSVLHKTLGTKYFYRVFFCFTEYTRQTSMCTECPIKNTRYSCKHSVHLHIMVVNVLRNCLQLSYPLQCLSASMCARSAAVSFLFSWIWMVCLLVCI